MKRKHKQKTVGFDRAFDEGKAAIDCSRGVLTDGLSKEKNRKIRSFFGKMTRKQFDSFQKATEGFSHIATGSENNPLKIPDRPRRFRR